MKLARIQVRIRECADGQGWRFARGEETGTTLFDSAGEALERAKDIGRRSAPSLVTIVWEPATRIGTLAVRVLASEVRS